ncbi:MAG: prepilin-type N-terminal cleavage/methylation domain-containing protein [Deltaproteobacteria bacterium]|nr:prepilin-type N-terminal cleavage/methylation domain-containing protein [Deltaproteobacteria bacterium]
MTTRLRQTQSEGGFTMVEMLVALVLVTIVLSGTLAMQVAVMQGNRKARQTSAAVALAQRHVEDFHISDYSTLAASGAATTCYSYELRVVGTVGPCVDTHPDGPWAYFVTQTIVGSAPGGFNLSVQVNERPTDNPAAGMGEYVSSYVSMRAPAGP